nr:hypothetical protein [Caldilineaceae bacterium]
MTQRSTKRPTKSGLVDLQQFTLDFFSEFGATVSQPKRKKQSACLVELPPELAAHFGRSSLGLCFQQNELAPGLDLVTPGSRVFDRMLALLDMRGAMTVLNLPLRHQGSEELMRAVRPVNVAISGLRMQEQQQLICAFNWRITYRADDKREELYTVLLDENGARLPQREEDPSAHGALDLQQIYADAGPAPLERNEDGQLSPPRLPPMTQLVRLAET